MARFLPAFALAGLTIGTAACGPETNRITPVSNPTVYSANQPVVSRTNYVFDIRSGYGGLAPDERQRLDDWFASLDLRYGDRLYVDAADPQLRAEVAALAARYGIVASTGPSPVVSSGGASRVVLARSEASVPGCPIWEDELVGAPERTSTNFGCATESNLAKMIADPNDLVLGQTPNDVTDASQSSRTVNAYRTRPVAK